MAPLIIFKINIAMDRASMDANLREVIEGVRTGCVIVGPEVDVLAFDSEGELVYPARNERVEKREATR